MRDSEESVALNFLSDAIGLALALVLGVVARGKSLDIDKGRLGVNGVGRDGFIGVDVGAICGGSEVWRRKQKSNANHLEVT